MTTHPNYPAALKYLYANLPIFQRVGAAAYKKDITNTIQLCEALGNPQNKFMSVHVAGTNGKGSSSHMLAAILQSAGYKTGLYTSPHLKEFTERIKVDGIEVAQSYVVDFVNRIKPSIEKIQPSFFEITVVMAFEYFVLREVDIAVIEVGLGGRLDSTNVITPVVSLITNIGDDHTDLLGNTLPEIAFEKAGIIKPGVPVVISQRQKEVERVFLEKAKENLARLEFGNEAYSLASARTGYSVANRNGLIFPDLQPELAGQYQQKNIPGVLLTVDKLIEKGFKILPEHVRNGIEKTVQLTGLKGRWQKLGESPLVICDTGHNQDGMKEVVQQILQQEFRKLYFVVGVVKDKDVSRVLALLPKEAHYIFCQARIPRALDAHQLMTQANAVGLVGEVIADVNEAIGKARKLAGKEDFIFIGGSTFVVAEINNL